MKWCSIGFIMALTGCQNMDAITAMHGPSETLKTDAKDGASKSTAATKSNSGHLYFNETFSDIPQDAWRYECMTALPHTQADLGYIIANVTSTVDHRECGRETYMTREQQMLDCCSESSGVTSLDEEQGAGDHDLNFSSEYCDGVFRQGYCPTPRKGTQRFVSWPTDTRTWPNNSKDIKNKKGGGEMAIRAKNTKEIPHPQLVEINASTGEVLAQGWDANATSYLQMGNTSFYGFKLRINDATMLTEQLAESAYLFQFHGRNNANDCEPVPDTEDDLAVAPLAALLLKQNEGSLELQFKTKSPDLPYYKHTLEPKSLSPELKDCTSGGINLCNTTLWKHPLADAEDTHALAIGKWITFVVEIKEAGRFKGYDDADCDDAALAATGKHLDQLICEYCDPDDVEAQDTLREIYETCRPSDGYLALYVNGHKVQGNVKAEDVCDELPTDTNGEPYCPETGGPYPKDRTLPWTYKQSTFEGMTTRFQSCPNYIKIGQYVLRYQYWRMADANEDESTSWEYPHNVPKLDTEFDFVRIASTRRLAESIEGGFTEAEVKFQK